MAACVPTFINTGVWTVRRCKRAAARMAVFANQLKHSLLAFLFGLPTYSNRLTHQVKRSRQICVLVDRCFLHMIFQYFQPQHHGNAEHKPENAKSESVMTCTELALSTTSCQNVAPGI